MRLKQEEVCFLGKIAFVGLWQGLYSQAERIFLALAKQETAKVGPYIGLAQCRMHQGRFDEADAELEKAEAIDPQDEHVRAWQAMVLLLRGETEAGKPLLKSLAEGAEAEDVRALARKLIEE